MVYSLMYFDKAISETPISFKHELETLLHGVKDKLHFICNDDIKDNQLGNIEEKYNNNWHHNNYYRNILASNYLLKAWEFTWGYSN